MRIVVLSVMFAGLLSAPLGAQDVAQQSVILDSMVARHRVAEARRKAFDDSLAQARQVLDTVRAGPFTVFVSPGNRGLVSEALGITLDSLAPLGDRMIAALQGMRFVARRVPSRTSSMPVTVFDRAYWVSAEPRPVAVTVLDRNNIEQHQYWDVNARAPLIAAYFTDHSRRRLASLVDSALARWVGGTLGAAQARFDTATTFEWTQLRLDLISATSPVPRRCYEGSMPDCRHVLGLDSAGSRVREYYDSLGRRYIVQRNAEQLKRRDFARTASCLAGSDSACISVLERSSVDVSIASLGHRVALLQLAIQRGGPDAAPRVLSAKGTPTQQLEAIAGIPIDSLTAAWHARIRDERVASDNMSAGMALASVGWLALFGILAARNKRWR
ncbi:MAG TPA: hypothetical protein VFO66_04400 [Gemmatimonadaceae bacterium]|nr:hypothetical protein [Gemmatimonadaceae bacterium]